MIGIDDIQLAKIIDIEYVNELIYFMIYKNAVITMIYNFMIVKIFFTIIMHRKS